MQKNQKIKAGALVLGQAVVKADNAKHDSPSAQTCTLL
jgi:hypothetical protein